ncbi:MAG: hypothetical protein KAI06_10265 [Anaerolineales bacterium]|nr:hypothetical protein [Anaerolineales bacterium]
MITFPQVLDNLERVADQLKSTEELEATISAMRDDLMGFIALLEYSHQKDFQDVGQALNYADNVLIPQLHGIRDSLEAGVTEPLKRLKLATDQADRLVVQMRMVINGDAEDFLI